MRKIVSISVRDGAEASEIYTAVASDGTVWECADTGITARDLSKWEQLKLPPLPPDEIRQTKG